MATIAGVYIPFFYLGVFLIALVLSMRADLWRCATFLTLLYLIAWVPEIWLNAPVHMLVNLALFGLITLTYATRLGWWLSILTCMMMLNNGYFSLIEGSEFYRHSIINLLFLAQCLLTIGFSYTSHKSHKREFSDGEGTLQAKISESIH